MTRFYLNVGYKDVKVVGETVKSYHAIAGITVQHTQTSQKSLSPF